MPRTARIDFPGARHHVMNRGAKGQTVFCNVDQCDRFLDLLGQAVSRYRIRVHGFAIMPNHFHLMVESVEGNLGQAMKYVCFQYGFYLNRAMGWDGQVFRGRYKNKPVYLEEHWIYLLAYLHLNPVRAHLTPDEDKAIWTSHRAYLGKTAGLEWLTTVEMQSYFESTGGYRQYIAEAKKKRSQPPEGFEKVTFDSRQSSKILVVKQEPVGPRMEVERALAAVQVVSGCTREEMLEQRRGRGGNPYKALAVWWLIHGAGLSNIEAGAVLKLSPTAVSHILMKLRQNPSTYAGGRVREWIKLLKEQ